VKGEMTAGWAQPRPLYLVAEIEKLQRAGKQLEADELRKQLHVHGAQDFRAVVDEDVLAAEEGPVYRFVILRPESGGMWQWPLKEGMLAGAFPFGAYPYDVYGAVTVLMGKSGLVHLYAHAYFAQVKRLTAGLEWSFQEQPADARFPVMIFHTFKWPEYARAGDVITKVGNAGFTEGVHLHYEIHNGWVWTPYDKRPNPAALF
jgi:hypothetical protein